MRNGLLLALLGSVLVVAPEPGGAAAAGTCGLAGAFRPYSAQITQGGGSAVMPPGARQLVLAGSRWRYGTSGGSFRVAPIGAADWRRWGGSPYGPTRKIVLSGWNGGTADGPIEGSADVVDFFWVIYPVRPPVVHTAGTVELKFGHAVVPASCGAPTSTAPAATADPVLTVAPASVTAGASVRVTAGPFAAHEDLDITESYRLGGTARRTTLVGGAANARGMLAFTHQTLLQAPPGVHTLCVSGASSHAKACGSFTVTSRTGTSGGSGSTSSGGYTSPTVGPGYVAPTSG